MRQPLVLGNWKLNGNKKSVADLVAGIRRDIKSVSPAEVGVCPPFVYLPSVLQALEGSPIKLGAQNVCENDQGAFTGEVSAPMLGDIGCHYVIVGHSERRQIYRESNQQVAAKFAAVQRAGLIPVLCIGETQQEWERKESEKVVWEQLEAVLKQVGIDAFAKAVIAYEPVWAIGTGNTATPDYAQKMHAFIRGKLASQNSKVAGGLRILYGGSVNNTNAAELFAQPDIDGGLIGGASLDAGKFLAICQAAG
ncbi:MAG TPA: triose-phosphate isomerase [Gammaproteobacteria bacterium]|nr:triose-phosphate isomerase [Gammaproteobacteria bacterium]